MRFALCFRGISFLKDFPYDQTVAPFDIDFNQVLPYFQKNIIEDLEKNGHQVDLFMSTYYSDKINKIILDLKPAAVKLQEYTFAEPGSASSVYNKILDVLYLVKEYSLTKKVNYDYIIVTRFDNLIYEKISNIYIPENALSTVTPRDDNFFIFSENLLNSIIPLFETLRHHNILTHDYTTIFTNHGIRCHTIYSHVYNQKHYPFLRTARQIFGKPGHGFKICDIDDLYNPNHRCYGFFYEQNKVFTPYVDPDELAKNPANHKSDPPNMTLG